MRLSISIHTLHTEGDSGKDTTKSEAGISIHTLHTEGDVISCVANTFFHTLFQSTPSTRRVTSSIAIFCFHLRISIHTLHTEGDSKYKQLYHICTSINCTIYPII